MMMLVMKHQYFDHSLLVLLLHSNNMNMVVAAWSWFDSNHIVAPFSFYSYDVSYTTGTGPTTSRKCPTTFQPVGDK
jgi:hypothetical protein